MVQLVWAVVSFNDKKGVKPPFFYTNLKMICILIVLINILNSCKLSKTNKFKPITITKIERLNKVNYNELFFETYNRWVISAIDSIALKNKTFILDTINGGSSNEYKLNLLFAPKIIQGQTYYIYEANVVSQEVKNQNKQYILFGLQFPEMDNSHFSNTNNKQLKKSFDVFFNTNYASLVPWNNFIRNKNIKNKDAISFSTDAIKFQNFAFSKGEKVYLKKVINNSFVKSIQKSNKTVYENSKRKDRNYFFVNFQNNSRKIFNIKTDYTLDAKFRVSNLRDSIYLELKFYSKRDKDVNLLIPNILKTQYSFKKSEFSEDNHFLINVKLNQIISIFLENNKFIRYGDGAY
jgi:hypothetical protein